MEHPELVLIPGKDLKKIKQELKNFNVQYNVLDKPFQEKTQIKFKWHVWPNEPNKIIYLDDILKGLKLPFFKPEPVELEWDITSYCPQNWTFDDWETNLVNDVNCWFFTNYKLRITKAEQKLVTDIVNNCIHEEIETLRIYTETLKPTFLHPHIQTLLNVCIFRKKLHVNMWCNIRKKLGLVYQSPTHIEYRKPADILELAVENLNTIISREEILEPAATECLARFTRKSQLTEFIKMVQRRDKESRENAKLLGILLSQIEKMYPFMNNLINHNYKCQQEYVKYTNDRLKFLQFVK